MPTASNSAGEAYDEICRAKLDTLLERTDNNYCLQTPMKQGARSSRNPGAQSSRNKGAASSESADVLVEQFPKLDIHDMGGIRQWKRDVSGRQQFHCLIANANRMA